MRITTGMLNELLARATARVQPPTDKGKRLKIYYMTQASTRPPTFVCFCQLKASCSTFPISGISKTRSAKPSAWWARPCASSSASAGKRYSRTCRGGAAMPCAQCNTGGIAAVCAVLRASYPYLLGSLSFSIIVSSAFCFTRTSATTAPRNAGMTNVLRTFGKGAAALTSSGRYRQGRGGRAAGEMVLFRRAFSNAAAMSGAVIRRLYLAAFCRGSLAMCTRCISASRAARPSLWPRAPSLRIEPVLILPLLAVFFIVFLCSKMVSLASVCCAAAYPAVTFLYFHFVAGRDVVLTTCCAAVIGGLVIWLHRSNIQRIKNGTEYKFGRKKK